MVLVVGRDGTGGCDERDVGGGGGTGGCDGRGSGGLVVVELV